MPVVANLSVFTYLSSGQIIAPPSGTNNFYALNNFSNVIFFDIEDGGSEDSILTINFTPNNQNITYTSHWFYMQPIGFIEKVVNEESTPRTFYRYSIQVPKQVLTNNQKNVGIVNEITVKQRFGFNYKGFVSLVEDLPNTNLETRYNEKETYYVLNEGFYQVIDNVGVYEWADVDDSIDLLSMVKQYSVGEIYVQKGYSNPLGVAPVTVTNTEYIMSILAQMQIKYNTVDEALDNHVTDLNNPHNVRAFQIPFDNSGTDLVSTIVENVIKEINTKANINTQDILDMINGDKKFNIVAYDVNFSGELEVGQTKWNDTFKCLETRLSDNVVIQHGQENLQYVRASTNVLETNAVYFTGSTGQRMNVGIASNTDKVKARGTIAIATETFTTQGAEQFGFVCTYGLVNGVKTDYAGWFTGQTLWLGANGALTNAMPTGTAYRTRVGIVGRVHGTDGSIFVNPQFIPTIDDLSQVNFTNPQEHDILVRNADGTFSNSQRLKLVEDEAVRLENDKSDKTYVDSQDALLQGQIDTNDIDIQGLQDNKEDKTNKAQDFTTVNETLYPSIQATKTELDKKVDKILTIIGLDLQNNISLEEFKVALGNVTQIVAGLMSPEDKTHLDNIVDLFNEDGDDIVNTIAEILAVFQNFPEGATILEVLATKVDKVAGKQLSTNDLTNTLKDYYDIAYAHSQIVNSNPHQTTYAQLLDKPTKIAQLGVDDVYDKTYIDALKDKNGWESELLGTLSNNGTIALSVINQYDEIQMYAKDTLGVIDNENIRPSLMQSGDSVYFFDDTQAFIMVDTVFGFYAPVGYTLQVVGLKYTDFTAEEVSFDDTVLTLGATNVQEAITKVVTERTPSQIKDIGLDSPVEELNNHTLREVFEDNNLIPYNMLQSTINGLTFEIANGVSYISGSSTAYTSKTIHSAESSSKWLMRNKRITGSSSASLYIISSNGNVYVDNIGQTSLLTERPITRISYEINDSSTYTNYSAITWVVNAGYLGIDTLTVEQMDYWFDVYQSIKEKSTTSYLLDALNQIKDIGLDTPFEQLNNHTLREVFEGIVLNPTFDNGNANWLLTGSGSVYNSIYTFIATSQYGNIRQVATSSYQNEKLYIVSSFKASSNEVFLLSRGNTSSTSFNQIAHSGSNDFEIKSMNWTNTTTELARFSVVDNRVSGWTNIEVDYIYVANQTALGIPALTVAQMDYWFDVYQSIKEKSATAYLLDALNQRPLIAQEAWIIPTLTGATSTYIKYRKDNFGTVVIEGNLAISTAGTNFTLPIGYRPLFAYTVGKLTFNTNGTVVSSATGNESISVRFTGGV